MLKVLGASRATRHAASRDLDAHIVFGALFNKSFAKDRRELQGLFNDFPERDKRVPRLVGTCEGERRREDPEEAALKNPPV